MILKTYGVSGLIDWTTQIKVGKGSVLVHFTGGALTAYGVTPAKYSTSKPFFQSVIENSEQFKSGRIELISTIEVSEAVGGGRNVSEPVGAGRNVSEPVGVGQNSSDVDSSVVVVKVGDKSEAIEYLKEHFPSQGYTATNLRTKAAFDAACVSCGVEFDFS